MAEPRLIRLPAAAINPVYRPWLNARQPRQVFFGGSGSGKSVFLASRCVLDALGGRNTLIVRQVARTLHHSCWSEVSKAIDRFGLKSRFSQSKAELSLRCEETGAQLLFAGLDDAEKIKSLTPERGVLTDIWVEEATECRWQDIKQLEKRLRGQSVHAKRLTLSFNPVSRAHWLYREYFEGWQSGQRLLESEDLLILRTTHLDNAFLTEADHAALAGEKDGYFHQVYTLGEWGLQEGLIFSDWRAADLSQSARTADKLRLGLDFGYARDPSAAVKLSLSAGRVEVLEELYLHGLSNRALAERLRPFCAGQPIVCDSAEPKAIQELRAHGIRALPARKGPDSVRHGLQWMARHQWVVDDHCPHFMEELRGYRWRQDKGGQALPLPQGADHLIDAARYALEGDMLTTAAQALDRKRFAR